MDFQAGNVFLPFYCSANSAAISGGASVTVPSSGWAVTCSVNGITQSVTSAIVTKRSNNPYIYDLNMNVTAIGEGSASIASTGVTVNPPMQAFVTTLYNTDSIYAKFVQAASIPVSNSGAAYGSWTACYSDDVILPITINIPSSLYGGSSSSLVGWTFTTFASGCPSISGGTVTIANPTAGLLTLSLLNNTLPPITGGASSISCVVEIHGLSPTALHLCVYRLNLTITT